MCAIVKLKCYVTLLNQRQNSRIPFAKLTQYPRLRFRAYIRSDISNAWLITHHASPPLQCRSAEKSSAQVENI